ncbi:MAG: hypothetical protein Q4P06_02295 [Actinomycetaceae bacterium]|nr:hypothetical protein [Actinomycetaceae bacterium]
MTAEWLGTIPLVLYTLALVVLPGAAVLRIAGFKGSLSVAGAPPISLGIIAASGIAASWLHLRWHLWVLLAGTALVTGLAWLARYLIVGRRPAPNTPQALRRPQLASTITLTTVVVATAFTAWMLIRARTPDLPVQQIDSTFHQSLPWLITQSGDASLLTAASYGMGMRAIPTYYPVVWHVLVATVGGPQNVIPATYALLIVMPAIWFLGIAGLALEAFPRSRWAPSASVSAALLFPAYPSYMLVYLPIWANALGIALIPAILALLLRCLRLLEELTTVGRRRALVAFLGFVLAYLGAVATYPITLLATLFLIIPLAGNIFFRIRDAILLKYGRRPSRIYVYVTVAVLVLAPLVLVWFNPRIIAFLQRDGYASFDHVIPKLKAIVTMWPLGTGAPWMWVAYILIGLIIVFGLLTTLTRGKQRWIAWSWMIGVLVLLAAYFPIWGLSGLTGLWYNSPYRILPVLILPTCLMAASIWQRLETWVKNRWQRSHREWTVVAAGLSILFALLAHGLTFTARIPLMEVAYNDPQNSPVYLADESELEMIKRVGPKLDEGLMVLGDPANGSTFIEPLAGRRVVFPHLTFRTLDTDAIFLARNFRFIDTDSRVCRILHHYGIGYYYQDEPGLITGIDPLERSPGLYRVDTSHGFELIDSSDTARIYKITACGTIVPKPVSWELNKGFEPIYDEYGRLNSFDEEGKLILPGTQK